MKRIKKVSDVVKHVLRTVPESRSNNNLLYYCVCEAMNHKALVMPFGTIFLNLEEYHLPNPETVTRARRKLQAEYPELSANDEMARYRGTQEQKFKEYAKAVNV